MLQMSNMFQMFENVSVHSDARRLVRAVLRTLPGRGRGRHPAGGGHPPQHHSGGGGDARAGAGQGGGGEGNYLAYYSLLLLSFLFL